MAEVSQPPAEQRFKAEMPQIPGVRGEPSRSSGGGSVWLIIGGLVAVLLAVFVGARVLSKSRRVENAAAQASPPQIDVPSSAELPVPVATETDPIISHVGELTRPWDAQAFNYRARSSGENVPALLIRLPGGANGLPGGYWALAMKAAYSSCQLEYVQDGAKLKGEYGFNQVRHPMIGNPCSKTLYDPLKYATLPGNILARGAIVQGSDLRPPLGIEIKIRGKDILAIRME